MRHEERSTWKAFYWFSDDLMGNDFGVGNLGMDCLRNTGGIRVQSKKDKIGKKVFRRSEAKIQNFIDTVILASNRNESVL